MDLRRVALAALFLMVMRDVACGQHLRWDDNDLIREGVVEAQKRLEKIGCRHAVGADDATALLTANYRILPMGKPQLLSNGRVRLLNATTIREAQLIIFNEEGSFVNPTLKSGGVQFNFGMSAVNLRALIILHELGHLIGRFAHDGDDPERSKAYTDLVRGSCF
jgi:hypothetical protein